MLAERPRSASATRHAVLSDRLAAYAADGYGMRVEQRSRSNRLVWDLPPDPLLGLSAAVALRSEVDRLQVQWVRQARGQGATWHEIGLALGVTGEAARQRFAEGDSDGASEAG